MKGPSTAGLAGAIALALGTLSLASSLPAGAQRHQPGMLVRWEAARVRQGAFVVTESLRVLATGQVVLDRTSVRARGRAQPVTQHVEGQLDAPALAALVRDTRAICGAHSTAQWHAPEAAALEVETGPAIACELVLPLADWRDGPHRLVYLAIQRAIGPLRGCPARAAWRCFDLPLGHEPDGEHPQACGCVTPAQLSCPRGLLAVVRARADGSPAVTCASNRPP